MKIGILTFHFAHNYGAMLQAYALNKTINSLGKDCEIIDYRHRYIYQWKEHYNVFSYYKAQREDGFSKVRSLARIIRHYKNLIYPEDIAWNLYENFRSRLKSSKRVWKSDLSKLKYDAIICGSDQIWNPTLTGGMDHPYFLEGIDVKKKISYAASTGYDNIEKKYCTKIKNLLLDYDFISCREHTLTENIKKLIDKEVITVCDPVYLLSKEEWNTLIPQKQEYNKEYILLYSFNEDNEFVNHVNFVSNYLQLPILKIGKDNPKFANIANLTYIEAGPIEFLALYKSSSYVITNTFHGLSFAIIFNRPFSVRLPKFRAERIINLLSLLDLEDRIDNQIAIDNICEPIDFHEVNNRINSMRKVSIDFLTKALAE